MIVNLISWPYFYFIKIFVIGLTIGLGRTNILAISRTMLRKKRL